MKWILFIILSVNAFGSLDEIGKKIWYNECKGSIEGLTSWNEGEEFPSLGIGHFIWYPEKVDGVFQETFPDLMRFFESKGIKVPEWAKGKAPWKSRDEFLKKIQTNEMKELRKLLKDHVGLQAEFISGRMEKLFSDIGYSKRVEALLKEPMGRYALIDYVNFKGTGISYKERYKGKGWGLLQVLESMKEDNLEEFVRAAKEILTERVSNAPFERNEQKWLKGWLTRVETYK